MGYYDNMCVIMTDSDIVDFMRKAYEDKKKETNIGYYSSFIKNINNIEQRIEDMHLCREKKISEHYLNELYYLID